MIKYIKTLVLVFTLTACGQNAVEMITPENANQKFEEFIAKEKFVADYNYPGLADESIKPILTKKINHVAYDFKSLAESKNPTDHKYHEKIKVGLSSFSELYFDLDTEDRERVCAYFEELMNIVGLDNSNGQLNKFMYGFDPK